MRDNVIKLYYVNEKIVSYEHIKFINNVFDICHVITTRKLVYYISYVT